MFKKNIKHKQANIFGFANIVSPKMAKALQDSQEQKFYELIFCNIKEDGFASLYSAKDSRSNVPVNCMVSAILGIPAEKLEMTVENLAYLKSKAIDRSRAKKVFESFSKRIFN